MRLSAKRNSDIEALRTVGVMFVLIGHSLQMFGSLPALEALLNLFNGSFAVDLFFAMSGYMITRGLLPSLQGAYRDGRHWQVVRAFWVRRMFRLWPLAWFWLMVILMLSLFWNKSGAFYSFVFAELSFRFVETPFRRLGNSLSAQLLNRDSAPVAQHDSINTDPEADKPRSSLTV